jgi:hypothetical protein
LFVFERDLELVVLEEIVFLAAVALGALKAADEQHGHAYRHQNGENASIHCEPTHQVLHFPTALAGAPLTTICLQTTMQGNKLDENPTLKVIPGRC